MGIHRLADDHMPHPRTLYGFVNIFFSYSKFWARNRPGDTMKDKYNLDIQDSQEDGECSTFAIFFCFCLYLKHVLLYLPTVLKYSNKVH